VAAVAAVAIARGGSIGTLLLTAAAGLSVLLFVPLAIRRPFAATYLAVEAPILLLLLSTLVFRTRATTDIAQNPLDAAAGYRVACVTGALLLAWIALIVPRRSQAIRPTPFTFRLFAVYIAVVFLGALVSVDLQLTAYRGVELLAGATAILAAWRVGGLAAILRIERLLYWFIVVLVATVWVGVALAPSQTVLPSKPFPISIIGIYPQIAANGVGDLGAALMLWTLGRLLSPTGGMRKGSAWFLIAVGAVTLLAAQYRTGYLGIAVTLLVLALARGRKVLGIVGLAAVLVVGWFSFHSVVREIQPYALRGESTAKAKELSGRLVFWRKAIPVWEESPLIGRGLGTATRFEVLAPLGLETTSTIHGTWIEVLVGTGLAGVVLLALFLLRLWWFALRDLVNRRGRVWPGLLITFVVVHSATGSTFELFSTYTLLLLCLAFTLPRTRGRGTVPA
jgi:O-antigen ligase